MTVEEFLEKFETKFQREHPRAQAFGTGKIRPLRLDRRDGRDPMCPIEFVAGAWGAYSAGESIGMRSEVISQIILAADYIGPVNAVRQRMLAIVGLPPETPEAEVE